MGFINIMQSSNTFLKAVILTGISTQNQIERLRKYCEKKNLKIIREFVITQSSTNEEFAEVINFIRAQNKETALIFDTIDTMILKNYDYDEIFKYLRECHIVNNKTISPGVQDFLDSGFDFLFQNEYGKFYYIKNTSKKHEVQISAWIFELLDEISIHRYYQLFNKIYFKKYNSYLIFREMKKIYKKWLNEIALLSSQMPQKMAIGAHLDKFRSTTRRKFIRLFLDLYKNEMTQ